MNVVYKLVRGVMKHPRAPQSIALIETCAEMCRTEGVNFAEVLIEVLQDSPSEGHGALYWIITNDRIRYRHELLSAILKHSGPLSSKTIDEVDRACTRCRDQTIFSHLWKHPAYHALSGTDELSLDGTSPMDHVEARDSSGLVSGLIVRFEIIQFHKRMSTSGSIVLKFVAKRSSTC